MEEFSRELPNLGGAAVRGEVVGECALPPAGWYCMRAAGHSGPCAAVAKPIDHEAEILEVIGQRDHYHERADDLAGAIASYLGADIGEHSSDNCPWANAIEELDLADPYDRAPAAQASAIIQAAPDIDAVRYRRLRVLGAAPYGSQHLEYGDVMRFQNLDAYVDADRVAYASRGEADSATPAATIQKPVMVAEPDSLSLKQAPDLGQGDASTRLWLQAHGYGNVTPLHALIDLSERVAKFTAAPMVADPAGVALTPEKIFETADSFFVWDAADWHKATSGSIGMPGLLAYTRAAFAATVKAVPSEALDDAQRERIRDGLSIALGGAMDCTRVWSAWGIGAMSEDDFQLLADNDERLDELVDAVAANFAAPLAGKTGGGE